MNYTDGTYKILYIKQDGSYLPIGCLTSNSFNESVEMLDTTTRDNSNGWTTSRPTTQSYDISFDGLITQELALSTKITYGVLKQLKRSRELVEWKIEDDSGNIDYGSAYITALGDSATIDELTTFNGSLKGYGEPVEPISEIYNAYENRVITNGGNITSEACQLTFIKELIAE